MRGHAECAAEISRLVSVDDMSILHICQHEDEEFNVTKIDTADETQSTALHYAVKNVLSLFSLLPFFVSLCISVLPGHRIHANI